MLITKLKLTIYSQLMRPDRLWGPPSSCKMGIRDPFPGGKAQLGLDADYSPPLELRLSMSRSYTSSPPMCHHGM
jgi:hypothetical protein